MFKLLKKIVEVGDATEKYPFKPYDVCKDFRGKPEYKAEQCIACGACTMACPANALTMATDKKTGKRTWSLFIGRCIFCGRCEEVCPTHAIRLSEEFELAVFNKEDMFQTAEFNVTRCQVCHQPYAAKKSIDYAIALLVQSGMSEEDAQSRRHQFETCPECKRKESLINAPITALGLHMNKEADK